jgi:hypothetical protein
VLLVLMELVTPQVERVPMEILEMRGLMAMQATKVLLVPTERAQMQVLQEQVEITEQLE